jgi:DUF1009 family protein
MRFDVPVVGTKTLETAAAAKIHAVGVEAGATLLLDRSRVTEAAAAHSISRSPTYSFPAMCLARQSARSNW